MAVGLSALLPACGPGGGGSGGAGGGTSAPAPASQRGLTLTDKSGTLVQPNIILNQRFTVPRGDGAVVFVPTGGDIYGTPDSVAVRVGKDGTVKWAKRYHFPENAFVQSAVDDGQGVTFVAGQDPTVYVVRIDDSGAIRAQQAYETDGGGQLSGTTPYTVAAMSDGGLLVSAGYIFRVAADLSLAWSENVGTAVQRMVELPDGDIALVGDVAGMRVTRLSPTGERRFVGFGGIKGNFSHAGITPVDGGGFMVVSGVDASDELVSTVTGVFSADGKTASFKGVQMQIQTENGTVPLQFGGGFHLQRTSSGRVWASVEASSGGIGAALHGRYVLGFDGQEPVDVMTAGTAFGLQGNVVIGVLPGPAAGQDTLVWVPRPQEGTCLAGPENLRSKELTAPSYSLVDGPAFGPFMVTEADGAAQADDLVATLSDDLCP